MFGRKSKEEKDPNYVRSEWSEYVEQKKDKTVYHKEVDVEGNDESKVARAARDLIE